MISWPRPGARRSCHRTSWPRWAAPKTGDPNATLAVLGPGTGFGVSALIRDINGRQMAMASEGGHVCFAPGDPVEDEMLRILRRRYDRVSIERLISAPGLLNLHKALAEIDGRQSRIDDPAAITEAALVDPNSPCGATLARFCAILGAVAGDIALTTGARGGSSISPVASPRASCPSSRPARSANDSNARAGSRTIWRPFLTRVMSCTNRRPCWGRGG